jgi:hypothetical protein
MVTIERIKGTVSCTIIESRFRTGAHILSDFDRNMPLQLLNAKLISLLLMYFTSILTSLISQALLQGALDKEASHLPR